MPRTAVYAGSFDPITNGHLWVIQQGSKLFDELWVLVGNNPAKTYTFTADERVSMIVKSIKGTQDSSLSLNVRVSVLGNFFLVDYAKARNAEWIIRGVRSEKDYQYEIDMLDQNKRKAPEIETIFLTPPAELRRVSSSFVKGFVGQVGWEGWVKECLPRSIHSDFISRFRK